VTAKEDVAMNIPGRRMCRKINILENITIYSIFFKYK
jgi:hypothetical protein